MAPQTVGDHIRKRRLGLKLLQRDVAGQLCVDKTSVFNWEANTSKPETRYMPAIIRFVGYNTLPMANNLAEQLVRQRISLGFRRRSRPSGLAVTPARWRSGSGAKGNRRASSWSG